MNIQPHILSILEQGRTEANVYYLPDQQFDRKVYLEVNKVLEALGGKWNRKAKAHLFPSDISERIDNVLLTGEVIDRKKEFQIFETPPDIVTRLLELAEIQPGQICLEPEAGRGNIAIPMRVRAQDENLPAFVTCVELLPENAVILRGLGFSTYETDFLSFQIDQQFDRIVMNPPFSAQQDILHVEHALTLLKPDGILVSIMSAGMKFRQNRRTLDFKASLEAYQVEMIELPAGAFQVSGTMVNAIILKVRKV
jgi:hypothetical protein